MSAKTLRRIAAQQRLMRRMAEARLAEIAADLDRLRAREDAIVGAASDDGPLGSVFAAAAGARLLSLARERAALQARQTETRAVLLHHSRLGLGADKVAARREAAAAEQSDRAALAAIVEAIGQGLGKPDKAG